MNEIRFSQPSLKVGEKNKEKKFFSLFKKILIFIILLMVLATVGIFFGRDLWKMVFINKDESYSAVFLTNSQVYFGKIIKNNEEEMMLTNVFYVKVNENSASENPSNALNQISFNLIKLGNELHGPTNEMFINKNQILFYEKLRNDSKVVQSIKQVAGN